MTLDRIAITVLIGLLSFFALKVLANETELARREPAIEQIGRIQKNSEGIITIGKDVEYLKKSSDRQDKKLDV